MYNFYNVDSEKWTIALYEKLGRAYKEIGIFFEDVVVRSEAFELFGEMCNAVPTWQAVEYALEVDAQGGEIPAFEVRLIDSKNKVLATVLWDVESIKQFVADYKSRNIKQYKLTLLAEIDEEDIEEDIDWELLANTGKLTVLDIQPN